MKIILCITGSIAAVEDLKLVHQLQRSGFEVECFMSPSACELITPLSMEFATKNPVNTKITGYVEHVTNAQADLILVAPSTANTISKFANKIADTNVTTLLLTASGYDTPILFVPSMHISMYRAIEENINKIKNQHPQVHFMEPVNAERKAKFPSKEDIVLEVERMLSDATFKNKNVLITAGATIESIDPMRIITNRSSGKMGVELAKQFYRQGANVTLLCGRTQNDIPSNFNSIHVESTRQMLDVVTELVDDMDIYVSAAAISDFRPDNDSTSKISSDSDVTLSLVRLPKILEKVKQLNPDIFAVGFKAESGLTEDDLIDRARSRIEKYGVDLMVANDISRAECEPGSNSNEVYLVDKKSCDKLPLDSKRNISQKIVEKISELYNSH
ncbi:bifunctional phosphopantothenoylcysteine decarboxylase/phosphopantothenate--cysteine ligase CoaBC [Methanosphaera sp. BMS]|uniref:bifunctional phosphopantothenoylcysteine decarboxylase/phosphopantothenate--cysteine ligase CoaBC n=1 Tax=Methanosphaera sp. BMS TaxID=1789762 RepID=UPI000DC1C56F|nr:bifunctional phosphopantothenoylcysteine decarboxylase/phosphopantothenate--cysteine ligase CoaBC [Methanosphaera sp. BMS]AWX33107.1 bifunctional phosphopantothenoylcysteine decarboxylase/phosphopantothenate synthase [Methanosphaera sp. BMS]